MTRLRRHHLRPAQLAHAGGVRPEQPGDHVLRRQPAQPLHQLRRDLDRDQPGPDPRQRRHRRHAVRHHHHDRRRAAPTPRPSTSAPTTAASGSPATPAATWTEITRRAADPLDHPGRRRPHRRQPRLRRRSPGYRNGDPAAHVFRTTNGGTTWADISGNLPDAPVNDVVLDPRNPAAAVRRHRRRRLRTADGGVTGRRSGTGLPLVPVADLEATDTGTTTVLTAATYRPGHVQLTL